MRALIALLPGDGIGPEVIDEGARLLRAVAERSRHEFQLEKGAIGGTAIDATGTPLPDSTLALCRRADAVLLGAVGGPKWAPSAPVRPEQGLLALRKELGLFANLRPVTVHPRVASASPVKAELLADVDFVVVRELTGGIYFGEKTRTADSATKLRYHSAPGMTTVFSKRSSTSHGRAPSTRGRAPPWPRPCRTAPANYSNACSTARRTRPVRCRK